MIFRGIALWIGLATLCAGADWGPWAPLVGTWKSADSEMTFTSDLNDQILLRRNRSGAHQDLMVIGAPVAGHWNADYWDNEGHVIHYDCQADGAKVVCTSKAAPGPRFRYTYEVQQDQLHGLFEIAPPGGEFKVYKEGSLQRQRDSKS